VICFVATSCQWVGRYAPQTTVQARLGGDNRGEVGTAAVQESARMGEQVYGHSLHRATVEDAEVVSRIRLMMKHGLGRRGRQQ
jgi:hypothetical protein